MTILPKVFLSFIILPGRNNDNLVIFDAYASDVVSPCSYHMWAVATQTRYGDSLCFVHNFSAFSMNLCHIILPLFLLKSYQPPTGLSRNRRSEIIFGMRMMKEGDIRLPINWMPRIYARQMGGNDCGTLRKNFSECLFKRIET